MRSYEIMHTHLRQHLKTALCPPPSSAGSVTEGGGTRFHFRSHFRVSGVEYLVLEWSGEGDFSLLLLLVKLSYRPVTSSVQYRRDNDLGLLAKLETGAPWGLFLSLRSSTEQLIPSLAEDKRP